VGARINVRVDPQRDRRANAHFGGHNLQALKLFSGLDVEAVHAHFQSTTHVVTGLADTGKHNLVSRAASGQHTLQLTAGHDVKTGAKTRQDIEYTQVGVGLDGETDQVRHAVQGIGVSVVLRLDVRPGIDVSRRAETLGNGRQRNTFGEQLAVPVIKSVHGVPLLVLVRLRRLRLVFRGFAVIGQIQRSFLTTGRNKAGDRDERSNRRDQALHGEIL